MLFSGFGRGLPLSLQSLRPLARRLLVAVIAGAIGYLLNLFPLRLTDWLSGSFGCIAHLFSATVFGPLYGIITAAIASSAVDKQVILPSIVLASAEAAVVGYLVRYRQLQLLSAAILSRLALAPITIFLAGNETPEGLWLGFGEATVSALLGAAILQWLLLAMAHVRRLPRPRAAPRTFRSQLYEGFSTIAVVMVLVLTVTFAQLLTDRRTDEVTFRLSVAAKTVGSGVHQYLFDHQKAMELLAETIEETGAAWDRQRLEFWLKQFHGKYPSILTILAANRAGKIIAGHPYGMLDGEEIRYGSDVSQWPYYQQPKVTGKPYLSNAYFGPGKVLEPVVSVSVPFRSDAGRFAGVIEGSLNLARMGDFKRYNPGVEVASIVIMDRLNRVVFAGGQAPYRFREDLTESDLARAVRSKEADTVVHYSRRVNGRADRERFLAGHAVVPQYGWAVFVEAPARLVREELLGLYSRLAVCAIAGVALCFFLAKIVAGRYTRPLEQLVVKVGKLPPWGAQKGTVAVHGEVPVEVAQLVDSFGNLSVRLVDAHAERAATLAQLEEKVRARTLELEQARTRAVDANRAKSTFLAMMSHEIRTPMSGVLGTIQLLEGTKLGAEQSEYVEMGRRSAESLLRILDDLLDLSKIEAGKLTLESVPFQLAECLEVSIAPFRALAHLKGLSVETRWPTIQSARVTGDPGRLRQVLTNLLSNAVKFTEKGVITIEANWRQECVERMCLEVTVADTGIGMLEETQSGLFTPFTQADNSTTRRFGGTGLGLAISKQLIGLLGGEIAVKSELGKGSTFHFWVPYKILQSPTLTSNGEGDTLDDKDLVSCTGARILLAEDNTVSLLVASKALSRAGYHVIEARTGKEALEIWERGEFDLILMDCQMPEMDGYEASRQIRLRENGSRRIPIIAMTATAMAGDREKCFDAGMDEFVAKPVPLKELTAVVNRVLWNSRRGPQQASSTVPPVCTASAIDRALSAADHGSVCR